MYPLLKKLGLPQAVGVYFDDRRAYVCHLIETPLGPLEVSRTSEAIDVEQNSSEAAKLLESLAGGRRFGRTQMAIGLPPERTYFSTRPIVTSGKDASPRVLLREALRAANAPVEEMAVDVVKSQPNRREVASIASCDKQYLMQLVQSLQGPSFRLSRVEPAACALLRAALQQNRPHRKAKTALRIFLGDNDGLAVLSANDLPMGWRHFHLPLGDEASAILSACRFLITVAEHCGLDGQLDAVLVHGRKDLTRLLDMDWLKLQISSKVHWSDRPALEGAEIARALALGCFDEEAPSFDLAQSIKPQPSLWDLLPWREFIMQTAVLVLMALFLLSRYVEVKDLYSAVCSQNMRTATGSTSQADLEREKQQLQQKVGAARKFLNSRVIWTSYQRELAASLPDNVFLTSFHGVSELGSSGKRGQTKPKKSLVLKGAVSIPENGLIPHEIDRLLNILRSSPLLQRNFPVIELAGLKQFQRVDQGDALAMFTVVCLPKDAKKPKG